MTDEKDLVWNNINIQIDISTSGFRYDAGLEHIFKEGYERYPDLSEMFAVKNAILNGNKNSELLKIIKTSSYNWLNLAWEIKDEKIFVYANPRGLKWQEPVDPITKSISYTYRTPEFSYEIKKEFPLPKSYNPKPKLNIDTRYLISNFDDTFIKFHLGIKKENIPKSMSGRNKIGYNSIAIDLPPENFLVPVSYWFFPQNKLLFGHLGCFGDARGVRKI